MSKFMSELAKRHEENSNLIKEIRASMDAAIRIQGASIKTLEIQIGQMSKVLQERRFGSPSSSTETNPRDHVKSISTIVEADSYSICRMGSSQYVVSTGQNRTLIKEKDPWSFTLPCFINNVCFNNALVDLGASVDDLIPTIEESEVVEGFRARNDARIFRYHSDCDHNKKIRIDCAYNLKFSCMIGPRCKEIDKVAEVSIIWNPVCVVVMLTLELGVVYLFETTMMSTLDLNDSESLKSYYSRFYKMMTELIRNQCKVTNHQVNVQFLLQLQPEWQRSQQAATKNRGKAIVNSSQPIYDHEPSMVAKDDETSKEKEIDKLIDLISLSIGNVVGARETVGSTLVQKYGIQCYNCKEFRHVAREYAADSRPIFDDEPLQKVSNDDHYNVFAIESAHPEQSKSVPDTYPIEQDAHNVIIDSLDMSYDRVEIDQNDEDNDLANERELLASLIEKLKYEIDESKNRNKFLETLNKVLVEKLKGELEDFKNKNKSLESSNNYFKEANNKLSETNNLMYTNYKKSEAELARRNSMEYAPQMEIECTKVRGDFLSYKMEYQKSCTKYTQTINELNQTISKMKDKLSAHQETISILSQQKEAKIKLYKTRKDKELDKVIALENKYKVLDNIVYKTGQSVQTMNMLNNKCQTSFAKPEFLKKAQRANPRLYDIGCYNDNLALMLAPESDEDKGIVISKLKKLIEKVKGKSVDTNLKNHRLFDNRMLLKVKDHQF
nr:hypothetical protein [Tanacetum cinerariifolium]